MKSTIKASNQEKKIVKSSNLFPVVGIGASAGGLSAFKKLVEAIPEDSGMAFVLVQHLAPDRESVLPEILQKFTTIPVLEISNDIKVEPNHIYVLPSNKMMIATDGVLLLTPRPAKNKSGKNLPIDLFFHSLAEVHETHAIGVVLSGTASDGTLGLKAIKDHGGITFAQDKESAAFEGMPNSAVAAGVVDFILAPEKIPEKLLEVTKIIITSAEDNQDVLLGNEEVFKQIISLLRVRKGADFTNYKQSTIRRRILRRMALSKHEQPVEYLKYLSEDDSELGVLYQDMLIPVTTFFRDPESFDYLREKILPLIKKNLVAGESVRVWVAGCSTGEEAYSIAICFKECFGDSAEKIQIFATDISKPAIAKARSGVYTPMELTGITPQQLNDFFTSKNGSYQVDKVIRDMCVFADHNFLNDPAFGRIDLISCRNVLIYMDSLLQKKALTAFHYSLKSQGFLLLGKSETTAAAADLFTSFSKTNKLFTRNEGSGRYKYMQSQRNERDISRTEPKIKIETLRTDFQKKADEILLWKYTPAAVVVNEAMDIVHFRGNTGKYLEQSPGKPSHNLLSMAKHGLAFELRTIVHKARAEKVPVVKENISFQLENTLYDISIEAIPLLDTVEPYYLILFYDSDSIGGVGSAKNKATRSGLKTKSTDADLRVQQLEQQLQQVREDMRSISDDQESANEELQSANEELLSGSEELQSLNEELETSKEELQSTNEELLIVNHELISLNEQITESKDYAEAIVATIQGPLLVLDKNLCIKTANRSFHQAFHLDETEIEGVLIYELANKQWDIPILRTLLEKMLPEKILLTNFQIRHTFSNLGERVLLLNARELINGKSFEKLILLSIDDITEREKAQEILNKKDKHLQHLFKELPAGVYSCDAEGRINFYNSAAARLWGREPEIGKEFWCGSWKMFTTDGSPIPLDQCPMAIALRERRIILGEELIIERSDGTRSNVLVYPQPEFGLSNEIIGAINMVIDITEQTIAKKILEESEHRFRDMVSSSPSLIAILQGEDLILSVANDSIIEHLGKGKEIIGKPYLETNPELEVQGMGTILREVYRTGTPYQSLESPVYLRRNGRKELSYYSYLVQPQRKISGEIEGLAIIATEVTPLAKLNMKMRESEARFRHLADSLPQKVWACDANGEVNYFNKVWLDYTGLSFKELKDQGWENIVHPDDWKENKERWQHSLDTGNDFEMEQRYLNKEGNYLWHLSRAIAYKDDVNKIKMWIGTNTEIHQHKRQKVELEKAVIERTYELKKANETLEEKNEDLRIMNKELESFAYVSSHDLQEPLRKIQTFSGLITKTETENLTKTGKDYFHWIQDAAKRMQILIEDLLTFSRVNAAERVFEDIDLRTIVEEIKIELQEIIDEKQAVIKICEHCTVHVVRFQFRQLLYNLISNALKFSNPDEPPLIIIESEIVNGANVQNSDLSPQKEYNHIYVIDNGIGFEPEFKDKIFEVFQKLHGKEKYAGTGIGLSIVKKIVENHDGMITATSELNEGARFDIYIPIN